MASIIVVSDGRTRVTTCVLTHDELQRLSPGMTVSCGDDLLVVSSNTVAELRQQFLVDHAPLAGTSRAGAVTGYRLTLPKDLLDRLVHGSPSPRDPKQMVVRDKAVTDVIGWHVDDLCKCGEPLWSDSKRCCECGAPISPVRTIEPRSYADQITFHVIGRPE